MRGAEIVARELSSVAGAALQVVGDIEDLIRREYSWVHGFVAQSALRDLD